MRTKRTSYQRPQFLQTKPFYIVQIPWVQTSGAKGSAYEWNNYAHAALHSILAAMQCQSKEDVRYWLTVARRQMNGAVKRIGASSAKVMPYGSGPAEEARLVAERFVNWRGTLYPYAPTTRQLTMGGAA